MIPLRKLILTSCIFRRSTNCRPITSRPDDNLYILCKHLEVSKEKARYMRLRLPCIQKIGEEDVKNMVNALHDIGYPKDVLVEYPNLFGLLPITLKYRYKVLEECGFHDIKPRQLLSYLTIMKQTSIGKLKMSSILPSMLNIANKLASCMTQWPMSLTTLVYGDVNLITLYDLRLKIIQRYFELMLDLTKDEFNRGIQTYPTIKHRPLSTINKTLGMLQAEIALPNHKIKSNLYLTHVDPENLRKILYYVRTLGGLDIKEVIRMYPKIATKNHLILIEMKKVLEKHGLTPEAQSRCLTIYTLSPATVDQRIKQAKSTPEFSIYINHPRFLKMIYHNKTVLRRLTDLKSNNKKCLSLNVLSGSSARYESFEKAPGDRLGKGKDLIFSIRQFLGNQYKKTEVRNILKRHPFWINIPLVEVRFVCDKLSKKFSPQDIFENCAVVLYPWYKIEEALKIINTKKYVNGIYLLSISNSQKLSLVLYLLEKSHYFSGNGVWTEKQQRNIAYLSDSKTLKSVK